MIPILKRLGIILTVPIWVPALVALLILWLIGFVVFAIIGAPIYWVVTGKDLLDSKYNIWENR